MKIAIPCENGEVMQHFGHATEFTVYTIEDIKPIEKETVTFDDTDHEKVAGGLKSRGVDLVICGNIGEGAHAAIDNAHMLLISGVTGNADECRRLRRGLRGRMQCMRWWLRRLWRRLPRAVRRDAHVHRYRHADGR